MSPFIKNIGLGAGGLVVGVVIYLAGSVTGGTYSGAILEHLVDEITGSTTQTTVALNAPNWSLGLPLSAPYASTTITAATSTAGTLASSTPYTFAVAALGGLNGTTTLSDPMTATTLASTTGAGPQVLNVYWAPVPGATGYVVFFATSSTATTYTQYFVATTTNQLTFATSSGALAGSNTLSVGTAFAAKFNPAGLSYINGNNGTATTTVASSSALDLNGNVRAISNSTTTNCYAATAGAVFYNTANSHEWGCNGAAWQKIF